MPDQTQAYLDCGWYLQTNPDVARHRIDPAVHFNRFGRFEGRMPCALTASGVEDDLWAGKQSLQALQALHNSPFAPERGWAAYALARWHAAQGDWAQADKMLADPQVEKALLAGFGLLAPVVLMIEAAGRSADQPRARHLLGLAQSQFGARAELQLMAANLMTKAQVFSPPAWTEPLRPIYAARNLGVPELEIAPTDFATADLPRFDRLRVPPQRRWPRWGARPLVSIIMPARNAAATLATALHSLSAQSWQNLEILLVDNGSTDATAQIGRDLAADDPRIRILDASAEPGAYAARNIGAAAARGDFITVQDADDWAHPRKIETQLRALLRAPKVQASVSHWVRATPDLWFTNWRADVGLIHRNVSSLMMRRTVQHQLGFWDRVRVGADTEFYHRLRTVYGHAAILEVLPGVPLSFGRQTPEALTQSGDLGLRSQFNGLRHSYDLASRAWHEAAKPHALETADSLGALCLPQYPATRPFPVDAALLLPPRHNGLRGMIKEPGL